MKKKEIPRQAIMILKKAISTNRIMLNADSRIVFICGAKINSETKNGRSLLFNYAKKYYKKFQFLLAEDFFKVFGDNDKNDLLSIEDKLSKYSDCIIMILESESVLAELGAFAINDELAKIMLVINDKQFSNCGSFIELGPLKKINQLSLFKPVIECSFDKILFSEGEIFSRLNKVGRKNKKHVCLITYNNFKNLEAKIQLLFISDLIALFEPVSLRELIDILKNIWDTEEKIDINFELSLLEALEYIHKNGSYYLFSNQKENLFFTFPYKEQLRIKTILIRFYQKYTQNKLALLKGKL